MGSVYRQQAQNGAVASSAEAFVPEELSKRLIN